MTNYVITYKIVTLKRGIMVTRWCSTEITSHGTMMAAIFIYFFLIIYLIINYHNQPYHQPDHMLFYMCIIIYMFLFILGIGALSFPFIVLCKGVFVLKEQNGQYINSDTDTHYVHTLCSIYV